MKTGKYKDLSHQIAEATRRIHASRVSPLPEGWCDFRTARQFCRDEIHAVLTELAQEFTVEGASEPGAFAAYTIEDIHRMILKFRDSRVG